MLKHLNVGFIGTGNLAQAMMKGLIESQTLEKTKIFASNRSTGKLQKVAEVLGIQTVNNNEAVIEKCPIVILAMKPQDLIAAVEPLGSIFDNDQIVVSLAAGIEFDRLAKLMPRCRLVRVMANTPSIIRRGVLGFCLKAPDGAVEALMEDLLKPLGYVVRLEEGDSFEALTVSCAAGTGFVFELMIYWQEWIEERGIDPVTARKMTVETFLGASLLASQSEASSIEDLLHKVTSKKGVTEAGLQSMQELEIERALRYSFEKAAIKNQELSRIK